jgi:hypothetical protein
MTVTGLGDPALPSLLTTRSFFRDHAEVTHELARVFEPGEIAPL